MDVSDFDFDLPPELIAQEPAAERSAARLLCLDRATGSIVHRHVFDLPDVLRAGDVVVVNNTRVFPARLLGHRVPSGGAVECVLLSRVPDAPERAEFWEALVHPGQKLKPGARVAFDGASTTLHGEILERRAFGRRLVRLWTDDGSPVDALVDAIGHVPLPPYIRRDDRVSDRESYQTIFADERGSVAAPTAGLHFTPPIVAELAAKGIDIVPITLHVGYGTFQPVRVNIVEEHALEPERFSIPPGTADTVNRALDEGRRVVAVGTTTTRTLEWAALEGEGRIRPGTGATNLFIYPGFTFQVVGGLLTNFHLPKSSLIMLVSAFAGREHVLMAYREAVQYRYRFYSYGEAMIIV